MDKEWPSPLARKGAIALMQNNSKPLDFDRIKYLLNPYQFADIQVTIVGLGSGGAPVCDHLTMNGVRRWHLYDPDTLEAVNLVKHPRRRSELGISKVEIQKQWILDRNPNAEVAAFPEDILISESFEASVATSALVLACPDQLAVREFISDRCVAAGIPFVVASVFRTGIGGEVFGYVPTKTGCYRCLQSFANKNEIDLTDNALGLTEEEEHRIYGLGERDFHASGLSIDIQMISLIQARMALSVLTRNYQTRLPDFRANWVLFGNRPSKGIFQSHFETKQLLLRPQRGCACYASQIKEERCDHETVAPQGDSSANV